MEAYTLDSLLRRDQVIDRFESFVWVDRYKDLGDFELVLQSTLEARTRLKVGTMLAMNRSHHVMVVETVEDSADADGKQTLTVKGRSLESILENRVAKESLSDTTTSPVWTITDAPADVAREIFYDICVT